MNINEKLGNKIMELGYFESFEIGDTDNNNPINLTLKLNNPGWYIKVNKDKRYNQPLRYYLDWTQGLKHNDGVTIWASHNITMYKRTYKTEKELIDAITNLINDMAT